MSELNWKVYDEEFNDQHVDLNDGFYATIGPEEVGWSWFVAIDGHEETGGRVASEAEAKRAVENWNDNHIEQVGMARMEPQWGEITAPNQ